MLLTIAGVIAAIAIMNAIYPAVTRSSSALTAASSTVDERIKTNIEIVHAVGELSSTSTWVDTNSNSLFDFFAWVKNVGDARVVAIDETDVFFGQPGGIERVPYTDDAGSSYPQWSYSIENGSDWGQAATIKLVVSFDDGCPSCSKPTGTYFIKVVTPNGVSNEHYFSM